MRTTPVSWQAWAVFRLASEPVPDRPGVGSYVDRPALTDTSNAMLAVFGDPGMAQEWRNRHPERNTMHVLPVCLTPMLRTL